MADKVMTRDELAKYNGQAGQPAYVAVEGVIYDVSANPAWQGGRHHGNLAGQDLTDVLLEKSPHGKRVLKDLPVVGRLAEQNTKTAAEGKSTAVFHITPFVKLSQKNRKAICGRLLNTPKQKKGNHK